MALKELWLYDNRLTRLEGKTFSNLTQLRLLVLSRNQISSVSPRAFSGLAELGEVSLHTNLLTSLREGTFQGLPKLVNISLKHNYISSLPAGLLQGQTQLGQLVLHNNSLPNLPSELLSTLTVAKEVLLADNPWRCDQDIVPLRDWLTRHPTKTNLSAVVCLTPSALRGYSIANLTNNELMQDTTTAIPDIAPTEKRRKPHTPPSKTSTPSPAAEATPTQEQGEDTGSGRGNGEGVSRNTQILITAVVCTAVITSLIVCCVCWRRNKRGSRNLGRRNKNNSVI